MKCFFIVLLLVTAGSLAENKQEDRFFWHDKDVDEKVVIQILKLMNTCLELKLESELFHTVLQKLCVQVEKLSIKCAEKDRLQERLHNFITALSKRSSDDNLSLEDFRKEIEHILVLFDKEGNEDNTVD